eukprot:436283-Amphidinium_carterae.2
MCLLTLEKPTNYVKTDSPTEIIQMLMPWHLNSRMFRTSVCGCIFVLQVQSNAEAVLAVA